MMLLARHVRATAPRGYTLLELLLALGLSVLIVGAITTAISVFLMNLNRQQRSLEQKQIARSVLQIFSNDFRAGLQYKAVDVSGIENLSVSQDLIAGLLGGGSSGSSASGGGDTGGSGSGGGSPMAGGSGMPTGGAAGTGGGQSGSDGASAESADESAGSEGSEEDSGAYRPTLIGYSNALSIDISRLPRLDQYHALLTGSDSSSMTGSDVKTVSYFVSPSPPSNGQGMEFEPEVAALGGLYRRQVDRAVAEYQQQSSIPGSPDQNSQLISPEIVEIQFRYFDGSDWQTSWDSDESGGFPLAIEVVLVLDPARTARTSQVSLNDLLQLETYRLVVHLPAAEAPPEEDE